MRARSAASTATTPSAVCRGNVNPSKTAAATGDLTIAAWTRPGGEMSSTKRVSPVRKCSSSSRVIGAPVHVVIARSAPRGGPPSRPGLSALNVHWPNLGTQTIGRRGDRTTRPAITRFPRPIRTRAWVGHHGDEIRLATPSYAWPGMGYDQAAGLLDYCMQVEAGPYEDIWVIDHLLVSKGVYGVSWIDSLWSSAAAGVTSSGIGDGGVRHSAGSSGDPGQGDRLDPPAVRGSIPVRGGGGMGPGRVRGGRRPTARAAAAPTKLFTRRLLLTEEEVTFRGRFWEVEGVTITPVPRTSSRYGWRVAR